MNKIIATDTDVIIDANEDDQISSEEIFFYSKLNSYKQSL
jgi:hypothetical protein